MRNENDIDAVLRAGLDDGVFPAAALLIAIDGEVVAEHAVGRTRAWDAEGAPAAEAWPEADAATRFDLASITKLVTAATLLTLLHERGGDASLPVAQVLPEFAEPSLQNVTVAHLLSHTAGFPPEWHDRSPDPGAARFRTGARRVDAPGAHRYSCVGYIWAGLAAEALGGASLDVLAERCVLAPLGMRESGFRPPAVLRDRVAATEFQTDPARGMVQGEVHDETAWALGGVAGNAGLFGTARDLLRLAEALRLPPGDSALPASVARAMTTPVAVADDGYGQALGPRIDETWTGGLRRPTVSHTGFTGTAVATEPRGRRSVVFLTNRVHPQRTSAEPIQAMRRRVTDAAAAAWGDHR
ncbi:serine hydrolase domain-containing protein [Microbacterium sp. zg-Y818]|uniref:serine hydrolase domain-containing protein n=1 Tax=unclassified Microbacterium TaxID=2609290 RepID=UPI00214C1CA8|nr:MULTISPECIES: serine hydrolase domain-containing protein [unclassified Microbacterium]MCR2799690.1 beta-lactamase family protein [Microbacterium sp. zg.Y818]WIM21679.1 serine hydrolase domain-containing protein [Microbacterium sp. zg-Y818]